MRLFLLSIVLLLALPMSAQDCFYQLRLTDSEGDGWNGAALVVRNGGESASYTLDATNDDGFSRVFYLPVANGQTVTLDYTTGAFPEEVGFSILDNNDSLIYEVTEPATDPALASFTVACRSCAPPPLSSIDVYRVRYNSVDIRFRSTPGDPTYRIEYGPDDFDPATDAGTEITTQDTMLRVTGLSSLSVYQFYISTICSDPSDTTVRRGPFRIRTQIQKDIGITSLVRPVTRCQPSTNDSVTVGITNFGGEAQQFFRLDFTVNGQPGGVNMPFDGIYTGVVGVDSTKFFTFDAQADLRQPGFYEFQIFTMLEEDQDLSNDTLTASVISLPVITQFPYFQDFEGGDGFWFASQGGRGPSSWSRAAPRGQRIDRAGSGDLAFVTNPRGQYNDDELSYLESPCFNFSGLEEAPYLSFLLSVDTEEEFDGLYLEASTDGGESWEIVERNSTGVNWYNNGLQQQWDGDGGFGEGYSLVGQQLREYAGEDQVRLRFAFRSDGDTRREGVAIDNIRLTDRPMVDFAVTRVGLINEANCFNEFDTVQIRLARLGQQAVENVNVYYSLNGDPAVVEQAPAPQTFGQQQTYNFDVRLQFGSASRQRNRLVAWVEAEGDSATYNDTVVYRFQLAQPVPFLADFENRRVPRSWELDSDIVIAQRLGSPSVALTDNLSEQDTFMRFTTANYGPLETGDELVFTFRQRDAAGNPVTGGITRLQVDGSVGCGTLMPTLVNEASPPDSTFVISLDEYAGENMYFDFLVEWATGDYFVIIDDISVRRCPADLNLRYTTAPPSGVFADDGTAYVLAGAGLAPYSYAWSNGDTTQSADSLSVAAYSVTVTDAIGCTDSLDLEVDLMAVSTSDPDALLENLEAYPNPTADRVNLRLRLPGPLALALEVYDGSGRRIEQRSIGRSGTLDAFVDLAGRAPGMYLIRVWAGEATRTVRVIKR